MSSLISDKEKGIISLMFQDLHDTFKIPISILKNAKKEISINVNPLYNTSANGKNNNSNRIEIINTYARVYYNPDKKKQFIEGTTTYPQSAVSLAVNEIKILLDQEAYNFIGDAKKIIIDEQTFYVKGPVSKTGIFASPFYKIYLSRTE